MTARFRRKKSAATFLVVALSISTVLLACASDPNGDWTLMTAQPKKYEIITAVEWDVDIRFNTALANKVGDGCMEFLGTAPGDDSEIQYTEFIPVEAEAPYSIFGWVQGNNVAANATVGVRWYDDDQVFDSAVTGFAGAVPSANVWHRLGNILTAPAAARYAKPYFKKDEDAHKTYLDDLHFSEMRIAFQATQNTGAQNIPNNVLTKVQFPDEIFDYGDHYDNAVNYRFTAQSNGLYLADGAVKLDKAVGFAGGNVTTMYLYKNGGGAGNVRILDKDYTVAGGRNRALLNTVPILLVRGDYLEIFAYHLEGVNVATVVSLDTSFAVFKVD